jgi:hypothetical protein
MEKRINQRIENYVQTFKSEIKSHIVENNLSTCPGDIMQFIYNYNILQFEKSDFQKRKRIKNIVPLNDRCNALRANSEQCTRRRKNGNIYCGTHIKGIPHGEINDSKKEPVQKNVKVWTEEIRGIIYYIDNNYNVYDPSNILNNIDNPSVIAKYTIDIVNGKKIYDIPELFKK